MPWRAATRLTRDEIERDLDFYGLLVMQNAIKPETEPVLNELAQANISTLMVTGDNLLTALSVARQCGMIPKLNRVIVVEAHEPVQHLENDLNAGDGLIIHSSADSGIPARIEWRLADEAVDLDNLDLNAIHEHANHPVSYVDDFSMHENNIKYIGNLTLFKIYPNRIYKQ